MSYFPQPFEDQQNSVNLSREQLLKQIIRRSRFEVLVVGGGIHGAAVARLCALNGLSCVLLERDDYASQTSSRSSKMAHGGLRYLEMFDLPLVFEGISAREDLFEVAPHLVKPAGFIIPIFEGEFLKRCRLKIGLKLYDLLCRSVDRKHLWSEASEIPPDLRSVIAGKLKGAFTYCDGVMDDTRLVIESILAARQEGAICLNYCEVLNIDAHGADSKISAIDHVSNKRFHLQAGIVVNCSGPWVAQMGRLSPSSLTKQLRFSRGSHLIFSVPWNLPPLFFSLPERGRYYWIWPHFAGTLVGTTERECKDLSRDPLPSADEVDEILARLAKDLPQAGLTRDKLHYCFAGIRTLVTRSGAGASGSISRRHRWVYQTRILSLLGGKFTSAFTTAFQGLKKIYKIASLKQKPNSLKARKLPGAAGDLEQCNAWSAAALAAGVPCNIIAATERRLGRRVRYLKHDFEVLGGVVLKSEVEMLVDSEQVECLEDLMRRRLMLEYLPDHGFSALPDIANILSVKIGSEQVEIQVKKYKERIAMIVAICRGDPNLGSK